MKHTNPFDLEIAVQLTIGMNHYNNLQDLKAQYAEAVDRKDEHGADEIETAIYATEDLFNGLKASLSVQLKMCVKDVDLLCRPVCKPEEQAQIINLFSRAVRTDYGVQAQEELSHAA